MMRHALVEGWLLLKSRGLVSPVLAVALAIPVSLAGVTLSVRQWLAPVIDLGDRESVVAVLVHPGMDAGQRRDWITDQARRHPDWKLAQVPPDELAQRLSSWFPYLEDVLGREGSEILPPMVEITTTDPESVSVLTDDAAVLAVGPTSSVNRLVGRAGRRFASVLFAVAVALVAGAVLLSAVWVHLELHRHADEIAIMRLMGATEGTVRGPFVVGVAVPSTLAAVLSVAATLAVVSWLARLVAPLGLMGVGVPIVVLVGQIVGAVGLPLAAAFITLERHASNDD